MSSDMFDDYLTAPEAPQPKNPHDFRLSAEVDSVNYYRRMVCSRCGQRYFLCTFLGVATINSFS